MIILKSPSPWKGIETWKHRELCWKPGMRSMNCCVSITNQTLLIIININHHSPTIISHLLGVEVPKHICDHHPRLRSWPAALHTWCLRFMITVWCCFTTAMHWFNNPNDWGICCDYNTYYISWKSLYATFVWRWTIIHGWWFNLSVYRVWYLKICFPHQVSSLLDGTYLLLQKQHVHCSLWKGHLAQILGVCLEILCVVSKHLEIQENTWMNT